MAINTRVRIPPSKLPLLEPAETLWIFPFTTLASGDTNVAAADSITLSEIPDGYMVTDAVLKIGGTLGADCTLQLRQGTTALTAASTAAAANFLRANNLPFTTSDGSHTLNLLIAGGAIAAAADIRVLVWLYQYRF
ncbi:MAG: hypothetical protein IPK75_18985 [Acidobacteria bacterium]|nr:hypothetical protein [Acidobacteriota bacterium]